MISIVGLNKAKVLVALYENAKVQGMGFLQVTAKPLTEEEATELLKTDPYFDYLRGHVMKVNLSSDTEFSERLYDRDNGEGAAEAAIGVLRSKEGL